jgi:hypothetical protein
MKTPAFKITCKNNTHALIMQRVLDEEHDLIIDMRDGNNLFLAIDALQEENQDVSLEDIQNDIIHAIEDVCMVFEFDYTPDLEISEFDPDEESDKIAISDEVSKFKAMLKELNEWANTYISQGSTPVQAIHMAQTRCELKHKKDLCLRFFKWVNNRG